MKVLLHSQIKFIKTQMKNKINIKTVYFFRFF